MKRRRPLNIKENEPITDGNLLLSLLAEYRDLRSDDKLTDSSEVTTDDIDTSYESEDENLQVNLVADSSWSCLCSLMDPSRVMSLE